MKDTFEDLANFTDIPYRTKDQKIWLLRTESGSFYKDFKINNYVALGWDKISKSLIQDDKLTDIEKKEKIHQQYPEESRPGLILSQMKTFYFQMKPGDYIVIPSKNSQSLAMGKLDDIIDSISHEIAEDEYAKCEFIHRRKVDWLNEIIPVNDVYISKVLRSHQAVTNISEYSDVLYRNIFPLYINENSIHLTLRKSSQTEMKLLDNIKLQNAIYQIISTIASIYSNTDIDDSISIKTAVGSPGFIEIISNSPLAIAGILCISRTVLGKFKNKDGVSISGIAAIISQLNEFFNDKVERDYRKAEIEEKNISNKKAEKELDLIDLKFEQEKAETEKKKAEVRKLNAEADSEEIKKLKELKNLNSTNSEQITGLTHQLEPHIVEINEVIENNNIHLPY